MPEDLISTSVLRDLLRSLVVSATAGGRPVRLPGPVPDYGQALERSARNLLQRQAGLDRERAEAAALVDRLLQHRPERQGLLVRNDRRLLTWGVLERLLRRSREARLTSHRESERLAALALVQSEHIDAEYYGVSRIADLRARAWAYIGESRRLRADLAGAGEAFAEAHTHLRVGTRDALERAVVLDFESSLRRCQGRLDEARRLLRRALEVFVDHGEAPRAGVALVHLADLRLAAGQPEQAIPLVREALRRIGGAQEPRRLLYAQHHLIRSLHAAGRLMEARGLLIKSRPLYRQFPDAWTQSHLRWLRGKVAAGFGQLAEAETELRAAREGFLAFESFLAASRVARDLAALDCQEPVGSTLLPAPCP
jgi:tetratricopeptide (TPR) repeat protein